MYSALRCNRGWRRYCKSKARAGTSPLLHHLYNQIQFSGPLSIADYMRNCLTHPLHGYYTTRPKIFGSSGDFVTAPHVSQVFPELVAVWISNFYRSHGGKDGYNLVELGPGTGQMLKTMLPTLQRLRTPPEQVILLEASPILMQSQKAAISAQTLNPTPQVKWTKTLDETLQETIKENRMTIFLAQEFLDALPVHVFHRVSDSESSSPAAWRERLVDISPETDKENPALRFVLSRVVTPANALLQLIKASSRDVLEICPEALSLVHRVGEHIRDNGGAGLFIDYGANEITGETVRALSKHMESGLLERPGECDVTADVNFGHLKGATEKIEGIEMWGAVTQREFLLRLGAAERFRVLGRAVVRQGGSDSVVDAKLKRLQEDYERLVGGGEGMGEQYKVAALTRSDDGVPFGFN